MAEVALYFLSENGSYGHQLSPPKNQEGTRWVQWLVRGVIVQWVLGGGYSGRWRGWGKGVQCLLERGEGLNSITI